MEKVRPIYVCNTQTVFKKWSADETKNEAAGGCFMNVVKPSAIFSFLWMSGARVFMGGLLAEQKMQSKCFLSSFYSRPL